ncbi:hypothetical protein SEA_REFUGE_37 [Mycobacterium phage Refuge]|uniref:Uncharacterized protein n=1 Tax=Mycobacterium phage Refuge TaxID=2517967 RepID=A0A482JEF7_9CAUD|nr:hypothetical protein KIV61_gp66 [Mycobacterium phage Refuge]QBP31114.1 hypothetical protein SEA_REFUGE_37 [Mycobacterium phage Refuge]
MTSLGGKLVVRRAGLPRYRIGQCPPVALGDRGLCLSYGASRMEPGRRGHSVGDYSTPQAGMFTVTATLPRVLGSGCPSIDPRWMVRDRHALALGHECDCPSDGRRLRWQDASPENLGRRAPFVRCPC